MSEYDVPKDFPLPVYAGAVAGTQPKLLLVRYEDGTYGEPGRSPREIHHNWKYCEEVIEHLRVKSLESAAGKRAHMTQEAILDQYLTRLLATGWMSDAEARWTLRKVAERLGWPTPPGALENGRDDDGRG